MNPPLQRCALCAADLPEDAYTKAEWHLLGGRCRVCAGDYKLCKARGLTLHEIRTACEMRVALQKAVRL